jgi:hypothetical protein
LINNNYGPFSGSDWCENHKIRYNNGETYTGGYVYGDDAGAFFCSPLKNVPECGIPYSGALTDIELLRWYPFYLSEIDTSLPDYETIDEVPDEMDILEYCGELKGGGTPEFAIHTPENEGEINTSHDRITVKDTPINTNYQIYSITGQLIQSGSTNPDISTVQLSKGMYILRLENGKAFKFVK